LKELIDGATRRRQIGNLFDERTDLGLGALDQFEAQALTLLTNPKTKEAFDLTLEDDRTRDRYGRNSWGQQLLLARRLVEAGVDILTTSLRGPLCGRVSNWDDHAVNHHVFDAIQYRAPYFDQAVSALIEDVYQRGLSERVLVVVTGEFGRTPKMNNGGNGGPALSKGTPGRDHWGNALSVMMAGGGIKGGTIVGSTNKRGERPAERPVRPGDHGGGEFHLGIKAVDPPAGALQKII